MRGTIIGCFSNNDHFTSNADYPTVKKWLNENGIWWFKAFFMHDALVILSKKSYMATKLAWI